MALCKARASSESCCRAEASSAVEVAMSGAEVSGLQPARQGTAAFFFDLRFFDDCADAENDAASATDNINASANAVAERNAATRR